ncbi:MAG TPA: Gfo/Idh/MocA family oxidoreductase [Bryobacteraceae bacterium]|nr:Gfo/Idh/MocA family oxidoreductase [Bryobacteraceae bacterium]
MSLLRVGIAGLGRMGAVHARHLKELGAERGDFQFAAMADASLERAKQVAADIGCDAPVYASADELAAARVCDAVVIVTPTDQHQHHAATFIAQGCRVLLEKPLTGTLEGDREFAAELDRDHPTALMLAFQRRFDPPLQYAKELLDSGAIGRLFKIYTALEDSNPAPDGYQSGGILPDMSVHNVDEILWLTGAVPQASLAIGSRLFSHRLTTCNEDFDDALLYVWFENGMVAQVQVSRNHVSGYRVETILFGETGQIHIGHFDQKPLEIIVEAYGKRGRSEPIASRTFTMRKYEGVLPEFVDRFGPAYKAEIAAFLDCCLAGSAFPTSHRDGVRAQEVISAGMKAVVGKDAGFSLAAL